MKNKETFKDGDYVKASSDILKNLAIYAKDKGVPVTSFIDENTLCWQNYPENKLYSLIHPSIQTENRITIDQFYQYCDNYHETKVEPIAVKVETQKQWDFVSEQLGHEWKTNWFGAERGQVQFISLDHKCRYSPIKSFDPGELLTFEEWVKENGLESEWEKYNKPKYKGGDWVKLLGAECYSGNGISDLYAIVQLIDYTKDLREKATGNSNPDFFFYYKGDLLGTNKKYIERMATPEEIKAAKGKGEITLSNGVKVAHTGKNKVKVCDIYFDIDILMEVLIGVKENVSLINGGWTTFDHISFNNKEFNMKDIDRLINFLEE